MIIDIKGNHDRIVDILMKVGEKDMDELIAYMEYNGFFEAPCSTQYHLSVKGGLAQHSLNVYDTAMKMRNALDTDIDERTIAVTALLHDLGKMGDRGKPNYSVNMVRSKTKNKETGEYDLVQSTAKPYETNPNLSYVPHSVRSIAIAERFITLTENEEFAILYHDAMYGDLKYAYQGKETPLSLLLHSADMWCSRVIEVEEREEE